MKGIPSKYGNGIMYRMPTTIDPQDNSYRFSMTVFDQGDKLIFQPYSKNHSRYDLMECPRPECKSINGLAPDRDRYVLSVRKGIQLYKINKYIQHGQPIYRYNMLDLNHFEFVIDNRFNFYRDRAQSYYNWLCKFTYSWLKRNGVSMPNMKFKTVKRHGGRTPEMYYLSRVLQYAVYPMVRDMYTYEHNNSFMHSLPKELSIHLRHKRSMRALTKSVFG
jgi:hypothetical protein